MKRQKQLPALPHRKGKAAPITLSNNDMVSHFTLVKLFGLTNIQNFHLCEVK